MEDDLLIAYFEPLFEPAVLNMSLLVPLLPETLPAPKRLREMVSRLSIDGRMRWVPDDGVVGQEMVPVRNLKMP